MASVGNLSVVMAVVAVVMSDQTEDILAKFKVQQYAPLVVSVCTCERSESWVTVCMAVTPHIHGDRPCHMHTHLHSQRSGNHNSSHFSPSGQREISRIAVTL